MKYCSKQNCKYWDYDSYSGMYKNHTGKPGACKLCLKCEDSLNKTECKDYCEKRLVTLKNLIVEFKTHNKH